MDDVNELALFAGGGGGILASKILRWNTVCAVEIERKPREMLFQRQQDGYLSKFPIWDDVRTFDGIPWRHKIDIITGGFPCQDISAAGKGAGITGRRSGLWKEYKRIIGEVRPTFVYAENSPRLRTRGLHTVLEDLDSLGYDARWGVLGAWHFGAPHKRNRMWILAHSDEERSPEWEGSSVCSQEKPKPSYCTKWPIEPNVGRVVNGLAGRVDRIKALGNGQVPRVAAAAWRILTASRY